MIYYVYLGIFIVLSIISIYLWRRYKSDPIIIWAAALICCGGLMGLQILLEQWWLAIAIEHQIYANLSTAIVSFLNIVVNVVPYSCGLLLFLNYNQLYIRQRWMLALILVPCSLSFVFLIDYTHNKMNVNIISLWGLINLLVIIYLSVRPIWQEKNSLERWIHITHGGVFVLPLIALNIYQLSSRSSDHILMLIVYVIIFSFILMFILYVRGSFLGVKRQSAQTIYVGTGLIYHSLKNSIGKIKLNALILRQELQAGNVAEAEKYVDHLLHTHDLLMTTMTKLSNSVNYDQRIYLKEERVDLLIEDILQPYKQLDHVRFITNMQACMLKIDRSLLVDCIQNIINNAVEAMNEAGALSITIENRKRQTRISFTDTGIGMSNKQIKRIYDAFYSTKQRTGKNFGLGMYFVRYAMELHRGKVEVASNLNKGTTISLIFRQVNIYEENSRPLFRG